MSNKHKSTGAVIPEDLLVAMLTALPGKALPSRRHAAIKKALFARVDAFKIGADTTVTKQAAHTLLVRAAEGRWINFAPNVDMKILHDDGTTRSWLARFGPGGRIPAHMQTGDEEAIIMEGWCFLEDTKMHCGDFHIIRKGARHGNIHSPDGCLIFVRSHSLTRHASELMAAR